MQHKNEVIENKFYKILNTVCKVNLLLRDFNAKIGQKPIFNLAIENSLP